VNVDVVIEDAIEESGFDVDGVSMKIELVDDGE
jgi:hypothetical protein